MATTVFVTLAVVAAFMALDKAALHVYTSEKDSDDTPAPLNQPTGPRTKWYYVDERRAASLTNRFGTDLPPCSPVVASDAVPAPPNAPPIIKQSESFRPRLGTIGEGDVVLTTEVLVAIECSVD